MKNGNLLIIILITVFLTGCYTTNRFSIINMEIFLPGNHNISSENKNAAVVYNNSNHKMDSVASSYILMEEMYYDTLNFDSIASEIYFDNFTNSLRDLSFHDTIIKLDNQYPNTIFDNFNILTKSEFDSLKALKSFDLLYSFDYFDIKDVTYEIIYGEIEMYVLIKSFWTIYDFNLNHEAKTLLKNDTIRFYHRSNSVSYIKNIEKVRPDHLNEASFDAGNLFSRLLVPHWEEVERLFYLSGNFQMQLANEYALKNEWLKAAEIWKKYTTNKNKNIRAKCMYNLGIANEMEGNLDAAIDWVIKSFYVFENRNSRHRKICLNYIKILSQRNLDIKALEQQI